eukprot:6201778-Pleurochrysis_carterae.AAC.2
MLSFQMRSFERASRELYLELLIRIFTNGLMSNNILAAPVPPPLTVALAVLSSRAVRSLRLDSQRAYCIINCRASFLAKESNAYMHRQALALLSGLERTSRNKQLSAELGTTAVRGAQRS